LTNGAARRVASRGAVGETDRGGRVSLLRKERLRRKGRGAWRGISGSLGSLEPVVLPL